MPESKPVTQGLDIAEAIVRAAVQHASREILAIRLPRELYAYMQGQQPPGQPLMLAGIKVVCSPLASPGFIFGRVKLRPRPGCHNGACCPTPSPTPSGDPCDALAESDPVCETE